MRCARALLVGLLLGGALAGCNRSEEPVVFGLAGPFRTAYGASMRRGAELAVKEINAAGGIHNRPLELLEMDDAALPDSAYAVADSLFDNPAVVAVVGHVNSGTTVQAAEVYQRGLPAVATSATSPEISRLGDWIFRVASSDSANAVQLARLANRIDVPTALLYQDEDYGRGLTESFRTAFESQGGRLLETDPYLPDTEDLTPFLERMKRSGVQLVFIAGLEEDAARIIRQAQQVGLDARFLGGDGLEGLVNMGSDFDGTLVGLLYHPDSSPEAASFAERYRAAYHRDADSFAALGYDATRLLAQAARQAGASRE
ncbi:MAG TPA: ABC transporter substrate-binding protein, partial [Longimicrobiaceae bacterium]|nr:ABC transporter substrate-binding protein [Longimicrobiaceae bacterium]